MVKQNIVFVENTPGSLQKVTKILAENQIRHLRLRLLRRTGIRKLPYGMR